MSRSMPIAILWSSLSGQDADNYVDAEGYLHTNFRLASSGEYLALVKPDGQTITSQYTPRFPEQLQDISYGLELNASTQMQLVDAESLARILVPDSPVSGWSDIDFNDTSWRGANGELSSAIGFERTDVVEIPSGLVSFLPYDEANGSETREVISATNLPIAGSSDFLDGQFGNALDFDGSTFIESPVPQGLRDGFTISTWIQPDVGNRTIISALSLDLKSGFWLGYNSGGPWLGIAAGAGEADGAKGSWSNANASDAMPTLGQWYHVAVTFDPSDTSEEVKFFVNGSKVTDGVSNANLPNGFMGDPEGVTLRIGIHNAGNFPFDGRMDDTAIFDRSLTEAEIALMSQGGVLGAGPFFDGLFRSEVADMHGANSSLYSRITFDAPNAAEFDLMRLRMNYDDGFVAFLNGIEIARDNVPDQVTWNSSADHERPNWRCDGAKRIRHFRAYPFAQSEW